MKLYFSANELSEIVLMSRFAEYVKESLGLRDDSLKNVVLILSLFLFLWYSFYKEKKNFFFLHFSSDVQCFFSKNEASRRCYIYPVVCVPTNWHTTE